MPLPRLLWDWGTAYDLFVSLDVLHNPAEYGLRSAWAAGVRARLPAAMRETLEQSLSLFHLPVHWVHVLPEPKDTATVLWHLGQVPPADRLAALMLAPEMVPEMREVLRGVAARRAWDERDKQVLQSVVARTEEKECWSSPQAVTHILEWWARPEEFGERYLEALHAYQESFFADEEKRIRPALQDALARAQALAERLALPDLVEELSKGLRFVKLPAVAELVLAPSYWCTPLMFMGKASAEREVWLFGARPPEASLVPGEVVPDALLQTLKALSDPTRLRILRYLSEEPLTPAQLSRRLRLRAPTVTHHLKVLRLAGLVQLRLGEGTGTEREPYAARLGAVAAAFASLSGFLGESEDGPPPP